MTNRTIRPYLFFASYAGYYAGIKANIPEELKSPAERLISRYNAIVSRRAANRIKY